MHGRAATRAQAAVRGFTARRRTERKREAARVKKEEERRQKMVREIAGMSGRRLHNFLKTRDVDVPEDADDEALRALAEANMHKSRIAWVKAQTTDGRTYYFHRKTKATSWKRPSNLVVEGSSPMERQSLADGSVFNFAKEQSTWAEGSTFDDRPTAPSLEESSGFPSSQVLPEPSVNTKSNVEWLVNNRQSLSA